PTSSSVAAGASADVSWFPRIGAGAAASTGGVSTYAHGYDDTPQVLLSGGSLEPGFATVSTTDSAVLAWSTSVLANDTLTLSDGHVAVVWASCGMNGGTANKDAFVYAIFPTDQLGHDGVIGLSFQGFSVIPGPQGGQPNFEDQTLVLASGAPAPIKYRMTSTDANDRAVRRIYMAAIAFAV